MYEIGGFLDLSANWPQKEPAHCPVLLNTARNCIRYLAQQRDIRRVLVPYYACHTVVRALQQDDVEIVYYSLDANFMPDLKGLDHDEYLLYVNYYGVMDGNVQKLSSKLPNLIVDNSQAYFSTPIKGVDTVSSPRKFFGLPDGGVLFPGRKLGHRKLPLDRSTDRFIYLAQRLDDGSQKVYPDSLAARQALENYPVRRMSRLTQYLLGSIDLDFAKDRRIHNWRTLDAVLGPSNKIRFELRKDAVPLFYPYFSTHSKLRSHLVSNHIFVGTYWPGVLDVVPADSFEARLVTDMIPLPVDQRYDTRHMKHMLGIISQMINHEPGFEKS